jgi:hypothetical protein
LAESNDETNGYGAFNHVLLGVRSGGLWLLVGQQGGHHAAKSRADGFCFNAKPISQRAGDADALGGYRYYKLELQPAGSGTCGFAGAAVQ